MAVSGAAVFAERARSRFAFIGMTMPCFADTWTPEERTPDTFGHFLMLCGATASIAVAHEENAEFTAKIEAEPPASSLGTPAAMVETDAHNRTPDIKRSIAMFAIQLSRNVFQSAACLLLAAVIVSASLTLGAVGIQSAEHAATAAIARQA